MTDLELIDEYIVKCRAFVNPRLLREVTSRGLYHVINFLPSDIDEAKAVARGRLAKMGKCFGDEEIDDISNRIQRIESLRDDLNKLKMTDCDKVLPVLKEMTELSESVKNYFKEN